MLCYGTKRLNEFQTGNFSLKKKKKRRKKSHVCDLPVCDLPWDSIKICKFNTEEKYVITLSFKKKRRLKI